ncbi:MAG: hypothetical protein WCC59_04690, partial [Terriglobales bacterium]
MAATCRAGAAAGGAAAAALTVAVRSLLHPVINPAITAAPIPSHPAEAFTSSSQDDQVTRSADHPMPR